MSGWHSLNDVLRERTEDEMAAFDRYDPRPAMSSYRLRRAAGPMGEKFLQGVEERLSRTERREYRSSDWLHDLRSAESRKGAETKKRGPKAVDA